MDKDNKTFWEHLEDMRGMLIRSAIYLLIFTIIAFCFKDFIFNNIILSPKGSNFITNRLLCKVGKLLSLKSLCIGNNDLNIINIQLSGQFMMHMYISFMSAIVLSSPLIIIEIWKFIKPALYKEEHQKIKSVVIICILLFLFGVFVSYYLIVPLTINFFASYTVSDTVTNQISLSSYIHTIFSVIITTGVVFEMPVFVFFLTKIGILNPSFLRKNRKYAIVIILAISSVITPPDIFSQLLVSIPLFLLYEISIIASKYAIPKDLKG